jgi:hypothetical protein
MDPIAQKVAARFRQASTPEQWELGGEILDKGEHHPAIKVLADDYKKILEGLKEAQEHSKGMKRIGVGRTEDPTLIGAHVIPAIEEMAEDARHVIQQLKQRLGL